MPIAKGFRRLQSNILTSRQAVTEISNLVRGSNIQQSGRPSVARFSSTRPIRKRVTSADRRAMLESFVDKYRAMNLGKFPSPTSAQKEVGGSYYLIKKMLQEMEYNLKISSVENGVVKEVKKQTKSEDTISRKVATDSSGSQDKSSSQITDDQQVSEDPWIESVSNFDSKSELKEETKPSISSADTKNNKITRDDTQNIATRIHVRKCHEKLEHNVKEESPLEDNFDFEDLESKVKQQDNRISNITSEQQKEDELREQTSLWGNLKSIATGFINIWKKR